MKNQKYMAVKSHECHPLIGLCKLLMILALVVAFHFSFIACLKAENHADGKGWPPKPNLLLKVAADSSSPCSVKFCLLPGMESL